MIEFRIKEKTKSLNESFRGDWRVRSAVAKRQRGKAMSACPQWTGGPLLNVRITRISRGVLDDDALPAACKHIRDGVASRLRIDDATRLVEWHYAQAKGVAEVVVQIWRTGDEAPPMPVGKPVVRKGKAFPVHVAADAGKRLSVVREPGMGTKRAPRAAYTPPRSKPVDADKEAGETFAPGPPGCRGCGCQIRAMDGGLCNVCLEDRLL